MKREVPTRRTGCAQQTQYNTAGSPPPGCGRLSQFGLSVVTVESSVACARRSSVPAAFSFVLQPANFARIVFCCVCVFNLRQLKKLLRCLQGMQDWRQFVFRVCVIFCAIDSRFQHRQQVFLKVVCSTQIRVEREVVSPCPEGKRKWDQKKEVGCGSRVWKQEDSVDLWKKLKRKPSTQSLKVCQRRCWMTYFALLKVTLDRPTAEADQRSKIWTWGIQHCNQERVWNQKEKVQSAAPRSGMLIVVVSLLPLLAPRWSCRLVGITHRDFRSEETAGYNIQHWIVCSGVGLRIEVRPVRVRPYRRRQEEKISQRRNERGLAGNFTQELVAEIQAGSWSVYKVCAIGTVWTWTNDWYGVAE